MFKKKQKYVRVDVFCSSVNGVDTSEFWKTVAIVSDRLNTKRIVKALMEFEKTRSINGQITIGDTVVPVSKYDPNEFARTKALEAAMKDDKLVVAMKRLAESPHFPNRYIEAGKLRINISRKDGA